MIKGAVTSQSLFLPLTLNAEILTMRLVLLYDVMTKSNPSSITFFNNLHSKSRMKFNIQSIVIGHAWVIEDGNNFAQIIREHCISNF